MFVYKSAVNLNLLFNSNVPTDRVRPYIVTGLVITYFQGEI